MQMWCNAFLEINKQRQYDLQISVVSPDLQSVKPEETWARVIHITYWI